MSKYLAPIHTWLFNKIKLLETIEKDIRNLNIISNEEKERLCKFLDNEYGTMLPDEPIENLIDTNNIHGWLQNKIQIAESRQSKLVLELIKKDNDLSMKNIMDIYKKHGKLSAKTVSIDTNLNVGEFIFNSTNNFLVEGMPCDRINTITENTENTFKWHSSRCLHEAYWNVTGNNVKVYYEFRKAFFNGFIEELGLNVKYNFDIIKTENGNSLNHEISTI